MVNNEEVVYEEIKIENMEYDLEEQMYLYPCPCGDTFFITLEELYDGETIATCPSCSLIIRVLYEPQNLPKLDENLFVQEKELFQSEIKVLEP